MIERRHVDRPATEADLAGFQERTIEVAETAERAGRHKTAHVVEEVVVGKQVHTDTQTVEDTVRRTEVEVERGGVRRRPQRQDGHGHVADLRDDGLGRLVGQHGRRDGDRRRAARAVQRRQRRRRGGAASPTTKTSSARTGRRTTAAPAAATRTTSRPTAAATSCAATASSRAAAGKTPSRTSASAGSATTPARPGSASRRRCGAAGNARRPDAARAGSPDTPQVFGIQPSTGSTRPACRGSAAATRAPPGPGRARHRAGRRSLRRRARRAARHRRSPARSRSAPAPCSSAGDDRLARGLAVGQVLVLVRAPLDERVREPARIGLDGDARGIAVAMQARRWSRRCRAGAPMPS